MNRPDKWIAEVSRLLGPQGVRTDASALEQHAWDALSDGRIHPQKRPEFHAPRCLVLPASTAEVRDVVLLANRERIPIVPFGGGSGLMGGALSVRAGIVMDLKRMAAVVSVDTMGQQARVQAGSVLETLDKTLHENRLMLGHDPWTYPVATVGGAISTNSLGYRGAKYGSMGDQVLGLEAVLPRGEVLQTRAVAKSSTGIDLNALLIGGEGCFGIITEATLRVFPLPEKRALQAYRFKSFEAGFTVITKIWQRGLRPALLDFGDDPGKSDGGAILYLAFEGARELVQAEERLGRSLCEAAGGRGLPRREAERFWDERHAIARRFMKNRRQRRERRNDVLRREFIHVALPVTRVLAFREAASEIVLGHGVELRESGLWIGPELFSMRLAQEANRDPVELQNAVAEVLRLAHRLGGSMEYCHGVGLKLAPLMSEEHGAGFDIMGRIKDALDPNRIMNPGKMGL